MTMTSQSALVADNLFDIDCQRPPVPGCGGIIGNDLSITTTSKSSLVSELPHSFFSLANAPLSSSLSVTSPTTHKPFLLQEPDGCACKMALCPEISEPCLSKMDVMVSILNDRLGVTYFRQFLSTKRASDILEFWLACVGYRKVDAGRCSSFALVIYKTFIASNSSRVRLTGTTRRAIKERLKFGNVDHTTFDNAVAEVQTLLLQEYYPLFLESDDYAEYIRARSVNQSPSSDGSSGHSSNCSQLQTAERDGRQHCNEDRLCKDNFSSRKTLEGTKTCGQISTNLHCTGDCLAQTGYVFFFV